MALDGKREPSNRSRPVARRGQELRIALTSESTSSVDDETVALELARRVAASDVSNETLTWLERARRAGQPYARTPPRVLPPRVRRYVRYCHRLLDASITLGQQRRLMIATGWLTLLSATVHIGLGQRPAADAELVAAFELARHADVTEIAAWAVETRSWVALTNGQFRLAADLSQQAQTLAPRNSSAYIQATAQEGRAHSRTSTVAGFSTRSPAPLVSPVLAQGSPATYAMPGTPTTQPESASNNDPEPCLYWADGTSARQHFGFGASPCLTDCPSSPRPWPTFWPTSVESATFVTTGPGPGLASATTGTSPSTRPAMSCASYGSARTGFHFRTTI